MSPLSLHRSGFKYCIIYKVALPKYTSEIAKKAALGSGSTPFWEIPATMEQSHGAYLAVTQLDKISGLGWFFVALNSAVCLG